MYIKKRMTKRVGILLVVMLVITAATVFVNGEGANISLSSLKQLLPSTNNANVIDDNTSALNFSKEFGKSKEELIKLKSKFGNWEDVRVKLSTDSYRNDIDKLKMTGDEIFELHRKGYSVSNIQIAQKLLPLCNKPLEDILKQKGKPDRYGYKEVVDSMGNVNKEVVKLSGKEWDDVILELGISLDVMEKRLGVSQAKLNEMKKEMQYIDIIDFALQSTALDKGFSMMWSNSKQGKTVVASVEAKEAEEKSVVTKAKTVYDEQTRLRESLVQTYQITDEEITLCTQNGIADIREIAFAKSLVNKYNVTFEKVFELKKNISDWQEVKKGLEGNK